MNILFVSAYVPSRIRVRPFSFIQALARRGHSITLVCGVAADEAGLLEQLRPFCERIIEVPVSKPAMLLGALRALPGPLPFQAALAFTPPMLRSLQAEARSGRYDVAHLEHLRASALGYALQEMPVVIDAVDCISLLFERTLRGSNSVKSQLMAFADLARTRRHEGRYGEQFDEILVSSPEDAWALRVLAGNADDAPPITVVPNGVDLSYFSPLAEPRDPQTLVLTGKMSYHANVAAALFLGREIMPLVWAKRPEVRLVIAGSSPTREVIGLADDRRVVVTGYVPDLRPYLARAALAVCPLRYGVGIQNKVLEAMAMGTPVIAAEQVTHALLASAGNDLVLADSAAEYAAAILSLLDNPQERNRLGIAGRAYVQRNHNWDNAALNLETIYRRARGDDELAGTPFAFLGRRSEG